MELGGQGVISVVSHVIPHWCVEASRKAERRQEVAKLSQKLSKLSEVIFCESNPIPVKWALQKMGIIESAELRLPLSSLAKADIFAL